MPGSSPPAARAGGGCVLVLAAGRGRRMGGPKGLMSVDGRAWWFVQQERIAASGRNAAWVVSPVVRSAIERAPGAALHLVDADPDAPMFASVLAGLGALLASPPLPGWVHVLPVDVPAPLRATLDALERGAGAGGVAVPRHAGKSGHPVCLAWGWVERELLPRATGTTTDGLRLDELIAGVRMEVDVTDDAVTVNLNTPEDVQRWIDGAADRRG